MVTSKLSLLRGKWKTEDRKMQKVKTKKRKEGEKKTANVKPNIPLDVSSLNYQESLSAT